MLRQTGRETKMAAVEGVSAETKLRGGGFQAEHMLTLNWK